jgi:predicted transglutaminase-like cysteine proteinase
MDCINNKLQWEGLILGLLLGFAVSAGIEISAELLNRVLEKHGEQAAERVSDWQALVADRSIVSDEQKLQRANDFFNQRIEFKDDRLVWGKEDYWATPLEFLVRGVGDCEDFSIAKYFTLRELGVSDEKMRLTYVKAVELNQHHMVLTYYATPASVPVVLDNLISEIKRASERKDLLPVYSFNGTGLWLAKFRGMGKLVGQSDRVGLWRILKERMLNPDF